MPSDSVRCRNSAEALSQYTCEPAKMIGLGPWPRRQRWRHDQLVVIDLRHQHVERQLQEHGPWYATGRNPDRGLDVLAQPLGIVDRGTPLGDGAHQGHLLHLLQRAATYGTNLGSATQYDER